MDLRRKLDLPAAAYHNRTCLVETDLSIPIAVAVDSVDGVRHFAKRRITPAADFGMGIGSRAVKGLVPIENRFCFLLDLEWILLGRSSSVCGATAVRTVRPVVERSSQREAFNHGVTVCSERADVPKSKDLKELGLLNHDSLGDAPFPIVPTMHELLRFDPDRLRGSTCEPDFVKASDRVRDKRLISLLTKPVFVGRRRVPGFRPGNPRLSALAIALQEMPPTFQTRHAAPAVATLLGRSSDDYRITHFRYDLTKLRARHLVERIGTSRHYRLTRIGRIVCETLEKSSGAANLPQQRVTNPLQVGVSALSA